MPPHRTLTLTGEERALLVDLRDHASLPYLCEGAAALLKIADEMRPAVVARPPRRHRRQSSTCAQRGGDQPRAQLSQRDNTLTRLVGALNAVSGQVTYRRASKITKSTLVQLYQDVRAAYPAAERISVIQDNLPIHTHPDVLVALEAQTTRWPFYRPSNWPKEPHEAARKGWGHLQLPIQIVPLPTYASWCNPIEKLWRKLRQEVTRLHRWANDLPRLREELERFLNQFASRSTDLLRLRRGRHGGAVYHSPASASGPLLSSPLFCVR